MHVTVHCLVRVNTQQVLLKKGEGEGEEEEEEGGGGEEKEEEGKRVEREGRRSGGQEGKGGKG